MKINGQQVKLVAYGAQKKGKPEHGFMILNKVKRPYKIGYQPVTVDPPEKEWMGKIGIFWGSTTSKPNATGGVAGEIPTDGLWVRGIYYAGGSWHYELFPVDDEFSPNRLSVEVVRPTLWRRFTNKLNELFPLVEAAKTI